MKKIKTKELKDCFRIETFRSVLDHYCSDPARSIRLTKNLKNEMTWLFGGHNATSRGEFFHRFWAIEFKERIFYVDCSERGTTVCMVGEPPCDGSDDGRQEICIQFLDGLDSKILALP